MARDDSTPPRDPEGKRPGRPSQGLERDGQQPRAEPRATGWAPRRGRSGYGMESIRPHLRAQLEQQRLLRPTFPPEPDDEDDQTS